MTQAPGTTRWAIVDDNDPSLRYSPGWALEEQALQQQQGLTLESGVPYLNTLHWISGNGSLTFDYHGSKILVWGFDPGTTAERASWQCFIDDSTQILHNPSPYTVPRNNWDLCDSATLLDNAVGAHRLTINVTTNSPTTSFWIDWIQYIPQPGFVFDIPDVHDRHEATMLMDNTDPAVRFDEGWTQYDTQQNNETNVTTQAQANVTINFVGTSLSWYGLYPPGLFIGDGQGSYSVNDSSSDVQFSWQSYPNIPTAIIREHFFSTADLPFGPHQIVVKYLGPSAESPPLTLDYLIIKNASIPQPTSSSADATSTDAGSSSTGEIGGGVVGGVIALVALILLYFWMKRRRRGRERRHSRAATPFMMTYEMPHTTMPVGSGLVSQGNSWAGTPNRGQEHPSHSRSGSGNLNQTSEQSPMLNSGGSHRETANDLLSVPSLSYVRPPPRNYLEQELDDLPSPNETLPIYTEIDNEK